MRPRSGFARTGAIATAVVLTATACGAAAGSADQPSPAPARPCGVADLTASVGEYGSMMSQPFLTVKLTNQGSTACLLRGYPLLDVVGTYVQHPGRPVRVSVEHGSTYERSDPGPHAILVAPHRFASFTIGTASAYNGPKGMLHGFEIRLGTADAPLVVRQDMSANGPRGKPIPVTETAVGLGIARP